MVWIIFECWPIWNLMIDSKFTLVHCHLYGDCRNDVFTWMCIFYNLTDVMCGSFRAVHLEWRRPMCSIFGLLMAVYLSCSYSAIHRYRFEGLLFFLFLLCLSVPYLKLSFDKIFTQDGPRTRFFNILKDLRLIFCKW